MHASWIGRLNIVKMSILPKANYKSNPYKNPDDIFAEIEKPILKSILNGTSLVAQWLRIHLPMEGTWVQALVREDPTCRGATKPVHHNY